MTVRLRFLMCLVILSSISAIFAQTQDDLIPISSDESLRVMLDAGSPLELGYESLGGETISIIVRSLSDDEAMDTVLSVTMPDNQHLAYNDDHQRDLPDLAQTDSALIDLWLPEAGVYTIRVSSYGDIAMGEVEISVSQTDRFRQDIDETDDQIRIEAQLPVWDSYRYDLAVSEDDVLTITAQDASNTLDVFLRIVDADGTIIAENDDHNSNDMSLNVFDAQITNLNVAGDGVYTIEVHDFMGQAGAFTLIITRE